MVGVLLGVNRGVRLFLNGPVGLLYDRMPRRGLLVFSLVLGTLSTIMYATGTGFWPLFAGRVIWGIAWSLIWIGCNAVVLDISTDQDRGENSGKYQMWSNLGAGFSFLAGGLFTDLFGFRRGLWSSAVLIALAMLAWLIFLPELQPEKTEEREKASADEPGSVPWKPVISAAVPVFVSRFVGWGVLTPTAILWLSGLIGEGWLVSDLLIPLATFTGIFRSLVTLVSMFSSRAAGFVSDRLKRRWLLIVWVLVVGGCGVWMMSMRILWLAMLGAFLAQVSGGGIGVLAPVIIGDQVPKKMHGRALGFLYIFGDLGGTIGPVVSLGLLNSGRFPVAQLYQAAAILMAAVIPFALFHARRER
jgi:MFS family permease